MEGVIYGLSVQLNGMLVDLEVSYSGGENGELEFEGIRVAEEVCDDNEVMVAEIEKHLECGLEAELVGGLAVYYKAIGIEFVNPHY
jgi:hypothetical protein